MIQYGIVIKMLIETKKSIESLKTINVSTYYIG